MDIARTTKASVAAGVLWLFGGGVSAAAPAEAYIQPITTDFPEVRLSVNVRNEAGSPIKGLTAKDFVLFEDLKEVGLTDFRAIEADADSTQKIDIVFVFDDTGSMAEEINGLKEKTIEFANIVSSSGFDYNLALISYKDSIHRGYRSTADAKEFKSWVAALKASGGGDEPENALDAINSAYGQTFREGAKVIFILITDATFHAKDSVSRLGMQEVIASLQSKHIQFHAVGPNIDQYKVMTAELGGAFYDKDSGQFKRIITQIAGGSAGNYELSFVSPRPEYDFTWRAVELTVNDLALKNAVSQYQAPSWVSASSRRDSLKGGESAYSPHLVVDGAADTAWVEGVSGSGVGEWLSLNFSEPVKVSRFTLHGDSAGVALPSRVAVVVNDEEKRFFEREKGKNVLSGEFEAQKSVTNFKVIIESASGDNVGFSEVVLLGGSPEAMVTPIKKAREARLAGDIAQDLNKKGEALYHKKKYDESIYYYKQAIEKDPTYAQAFSNLGLAYQRVKDYPSAIWANRKAIALARGKTKNVVSASSYYNIARIFEAQNKYEEALQNFHWAKSFKSHSAYDKGIARMETKLGL